MTVEHMSTTMSHKEFVHWQVYFGLLAQREELRKKR